MKKIGISLFLIVVLSMNLFAFTDKPITFSQLPEKAQQFVNKHFDGVKVLSVQMDDNEYEVKLADGTEIDFYRDGDWKSVDCGKKAVPYTIVPEPIKTYVLTKYPKNIIVSISYEHGQYEAELDNDIELMFDNNKVFIYEDAD